MSNTPNEINVNEFFDRFLGLLDVEKLSEIKLTNLLTSNVSIKTLERNGLSVCNLSVKNLNLGLGGKRFVCVCLELFCCYLFLLITSPSVYLN